LQKKISYEDSTATAVNNAISVQFIKLYITHEHMSNT